MPASGTTIEDDRSPETLGIGPTTLISGLTVPNLYQGEESDTLNRTKDTPIGIRGKIFPTSETTRRTPKGKHDGGRDSSPLREFITTGRHFRNSGILSDRVPFTPFSSSAQASTPNIPLAPPIPGFHAWSDPDKIHVLTALHSIEAVIQTVIEDFDDRDSDEESLHASLSSYMEFVNYLVESRLPERAGSLQARAICLVVLAGVAIFLGVVQLITLALIAGTATAGRDNSSTTVGKVINVFAFCGISFDTFGAMFALWTFRSLILTISKIERIVFEKQNLNVKIHFTLDTFSEARSPSSPPQQPRDTKAKIKRPSVAQNFTPITKDTPLKNLVKLFADFQQSSAEHHREAREVVHLIDDHLPVQEDCIALAIIAAGLVFFFVSLFSFIISSQPLSVWASTTVVVAVTFIILRINLSHQQPGSWRSIKLRVHTTIIKLFPFKNRGASGVGDELMIIHGLGHFP